MTDHPRILYVHKIGFGPKDGKEESVRLATEIDTDIGIPYVHKPIFDEVVEALKIAKHAMDNTFIRGGHGEGCLPAFDESHPAMKKIANAIAKAEGKDSR